MKARNGIAVPAGEGYAVPNANTDTGNRSVGRDKCGNIVHKSNGKVIEVVQEK